MLISGRSSAQNCIDIKPLSMITFSYKGSGYWTLCLNFRQKSLKELNKIISVIFLVAIKTSFRLFSIPLFLGSTQRIILAAIIGPSTGFKRSLNP